MHSIRHTLVVRTWSVGRILLCCWMLQVFALPATAQSRSFLLPMTTTLVAQDDPAEDADFEEGLKFRLGQGVPVDEAQAFSHFQQAAERGHVLAKAFIASQLFLGTGVEKDQQQANAVSTEILDELTALADGGDPIAEERLSQIYLLGIGVDQDLRKAFNWMEKAADQRNIEAEFWLGFYYFHGFGTDQDKALAVEWMRRAARRGYPEAQFELGRAYLGAEGVEKDNGYAAEWLEKAAKQGHANAQTLLGVMYRNGEGVDRDLEAATQWLKKAADQGNADATEILATLRSEEDEDEGVGPDENQMSDGTSAGLLVLLALAFLFFGKVLSLIFGRKFSGARGCLTCCIILFALSVAATVVSGIVTVMRRPNSGSEEIAELVSGNIGRAMGELFLPALICYVVLRLSGERFRKTKPVEGQEEEKRDQPETT